jgi:hypothetical protein
MSSWANRRQVHRRDLSQIPEELRPAPPIPRAERDEVRISETYQQEMSTEPSDGWPFFSSSGGSHNPVYYPALPSKTHTAPVDKRASVSPELASLLSSLTSPHTSIHSPHPEAKELVVGGKSYVFVLLRHLQKPSDNDLWISSYNSIRRYYTNRIIIIDDNSQLNTVNGKLFQAEVLTSDYAGAGETLPYYYFLMYRWADRMIFFHDTMFLYRPFRAEEVDTDARFHWSFENKDTTAPTRLKSFLPSLRNHQALLADVDHPERWRACFGVAMVVGIQVVERLEEKYKLFSTMPMMIRTRKDREMAERLVGLVMFHEKIVAMDSCDNFGDILAYPKAFQSESSNVTTARYELEQAGYGSALMKVWRGR